MADQSLTPEEQKERARQIITDYTGKEVSAENLDKKWTYAEHKMNNVNKVNLA